MVNKGIDHENDVTCNVMHAMFSFDNFAMEYKANSTYNFFALL